MIAQDKLRELAFTISLKPLGKKQQPTFNLKLLWTSSHFCGYFVREFT